MYCRLLGLFKQQDFMKATPPGDDSVPSEGGAIPSSAEMYIRQTGPDTYRQVLRDIRQKEIYKLIVDTNPASMKRFFRAVCFTFENTLRSIYCFRKLYQKWLQILQLQMNDYRYHYMFTTFVCVYPIKIKTLNIVPIVIQDFYYNRNTGH